MINKAADGSANHEKAEGSLASVARALGVGPGPALDRLLEIRLDTLERRMVTWLEEGPSAKPPLIFGAIAAVMRDVEAIGKDRHADVGGGRGYKFRGIDDVYNELHPILSRHGVFTVPRVLSDRHEERTSSSGKLTIYRILRIRYRFYAVDGSFVDAVVVGEGMDFGDKASNKAMAVGHKYALMQVFSIPTEDAKDPESDADHDLVPTFDAQNPRHTDRLAARCENAGLTEVEFSQAVKRMAGGAATDDRADEIIGEVIAARRAPPIHQGEARAAASVKTFSKDHAGHLEWLKKMLTKKDAMLSDADRTEIAAKLDGFPFEAIGDAWTEWLSESDLRKSEAAAAGKP